MKRTIQSALALVIIGSGICQGANTLRASFQSMSHPAIASSQPVQQMTKVSIQDPGLALIGELSGSLNPAVLQQLLALLIAEIEAAQAQSCGF